MSGCQGLEGEGIGRKWLGLLKGNVRGTRGNGNILYLHYIKISISRVLPYSFGRCYHWGKLLKDTCCLFVLWLILACDPTMISKSTNFLRASKEKKKKAATHSLGLHIKDSFKKKARTKKPQSNRLYSLQGGWGLSSGRRLTKGRRSMLAGGLRLRRPPAETSACSWLALGDSPSSCRSFLTY